MPTLLLSLLLAVTSTPAATTSQVVVTAPVLVYDATDRGACFNCMRKPKLLVDDPRVAALDGEGPRDSFAEYLADGEKQELLLAPVVSGGSLRLQYVPERRAVVARVTYAANRALTAAELAALGEFTRVQLLDGIGEGYGQGTGYRLKVWLHFDVMDKRSVSVSQSPR